MQVEGNWDLYARSYNGQEWSELQRLTNDAGPDISHTAVTDSEGVLWLAWQRPGRRNQPDRGKGLRRQPMAG